MEREDGLTEDQTGKLLRPETEAFKYACTASMEVRTGWHGSAFKFRGLFVANMAPPLPLPSMIPFCVCPRHPIKYQLVGVQKKRSLGNCAAFSPSSSSPTPPTREHDPPPKPTQESGVHSKRVGRDAFHPSSHSSSPHFDTPPTHHTMFHAPPPFNSSG